MTLASIKEKLQTNTDPIARGRLLGQLRSLERGQKSRSLYAAAPRLCVQCSVPIAFEQRRNKFCSHSCSATHNNMGRVHKEQTKQSLIERLLSISL